MSDATTDERYRRMVESLGALAQRSTDLVTVSSLEGRLVYVSESAREILGWDPAEMVGREAVETLHPDDLEPITKAITAHVGKEIEPPVLCFRVRHRDGSWRVLEGITVNLLDDPRVQGVVTSARDVTERQSAENKAALLTQVLDASHELVVLSDPLGRIVYANHASERLLGAYEGQDVRELASPALQARLRKDIMPVVRSLGVWSGEFELIDRRSNTSLPVAATLQAHRDEGDEISLVATIAHDISDLKVAQRRLEYEATHDTLTGLPNRALFREIGERAIGRAGRERDDIAVLFLDLDGFKLVNDSYGHDAGDSLLAGVARRLRDGVRLGDTVARLGGDEFVILCEHPRSKSQMLELSHRLIQLVSQPFPVDGGEVRVGASIGIAYEPTPGPTLSEMIREADIALYRAKHERGTAEVFDPSFLKL